MKKLFLQSNMQEGVRVLFTIRKGSFFTSRERRYTILGIESTCDDTGVAIVTQDRRVLADIRHSQADRHERYGGVFPRLAGDLHRERLPIAFSEALEASCLSMSQVDAIAVARGPGLAPSLHEGLLFARKLSHMYNKGLLGIHHMEAHSLVARLEYPDLEFPFLCLLISGGHTQLVIHEAIGRCIVLGSTLDDSIGEAFDKVAGFLRLTWMQSYSEAPRSGGAALEQCALHGTRTKWRLHLPIPMKGTSHCNFSFSGLKTAVKRLVEDGRQSDRWWEDAHFVSDVAATFQESCVEHLCDRVHQALKLCVTRPGKQRISTLVVAGGVACNKTIQSR
jgi:N6-L-threonylcarbamoyladenine synthase